MTSSEIETVLLVSTVRDGMRSSIEDHGYRVVNAIDGREAVELATELIPDLILLDLSTPIYGGLKAATEIRSDPELRHIPIVSVIPASGAERDLTFAMACDRTIDKPDLFRNMDVRLQELTSFHTSRG
jgi:CheY-like chemotaxis protein